MHIRKATLSDTSELAQIDKACLPKQASLADSFAMMVRDPQSHLWLAEVNSKPVGYILGIQQDGKTDHTITVQTGEDYVLQIAAIAVLPEYSGQQIGQKLLSQLEQSQDVKKYRASSQKLLWITSLLRNYLPKRAISTAKHLQIIMVTISMHAVCRNFILPQHLHAKLRL